MVAPPHHAPATRARARLHEGRWAWPRAGAPRRGWPPPPGAEPLPFPPNDRGMAGNGLDDAPVAVRATTVRTAAVAVSAE